MSLAQVYAHFIEPLDQAEKDASVKLEGIAKDFGVAFETMRCTLIGCVLRAMRHNRLSFTATKLQITQEEADELCRYMLEVEHMRTCTAIDNSTWCSDSLDEALQSAFNSNTFDLYITWLEFPEGTSIVFKH